MVQDFDSDHLKNKKHWNSFMSPFFVDATSINEALETKGAGIASRLTTKYHPCEFGEPDVSRRKTFDFRDVQRACRYQPLRGQRLKAMGRCFGGSARVRYKSLWLWPFFSKHPGPEKPPQRISFFSRVLIEFSVQ
jgi:hypothetical protein